MNLQRWNLPQMLQQHRAYKEKELQRVLRDKVEQIKFNYSKELNPRQIAFLQKDEAMCKAVEEIYNTLQGQLSFVLEENETLKAEYALLYKAHSELQDNYLKQVVKTNELRFKLLAP
jgi:hypothetical protein